MTAIRIGCLVLVLVSMTAGDTPRRDPVGVPKTCDANRSSPVVVLAFHDCVPSMLPTRSACRSVHLAHWFAPAEQAGGDEGCEDAESGRLGNAGQLRGEDAGRVVDERQPVDEQAVVVEAYTFAVLVAAASQEGDAGSFHRAEVDADAGVVGTCDAGTGEVGGECDLPDSIEYGGINVTGAAVEALRGVFADLYLGVVRDRSAPIERARGDRMVAAASKLPGDDLGDPRDVIPLKRTLGLTLVNLGFAKQAIPLSESVLAALNRQPASGPDDPQVLETREQLAMAYRVSGRADLALPIVRDVYDRRSRVMGPATTAREAFERHSAVQGPYSPATLAAERIEVYTALLAQHRRVFGNEAAAEPVLVAAHAAWNRRPNGAGAFDSGPGRPLLRVGQPPQPVGSEQP